MEKPGAEPFKVAVPRRSVVPWQFLGLCLSADNTASSSRTLASKRGTALQSGVAAWKRGVGHWKSGVGPWKFSVGAWKRWCRSVEAKVKVRGRNGVVPWNRFRVKCRMINGFANAIVF